MNVTGEHVQSDYIVTIDEFPGVRFENLSGGATSTEVSQVSPAGKQTMRNVTGKTRVAPITISKYQQRGIDDALIAWGRAKPGQRIPERLTVNKQPVNKLNVPNGKKTKFLRCSLTEFTDSDVNSESSEVGMLTLTLQPEDCI